MSYKLLLENFVTPDAIQGTLASLFLAVVHFVVHTDPVKQWAGYGSVFLGLCVGFFGVLKMYEMYRLQKALRKKAEKENEELGI